MAEELVGSARHGMTEVYAIVTPKTQGDELKADPIMNIKLHRGTTKKMGKLSTNSTAKNTVTRGSIYMKQATLPRHISRQTSDSSQKFLHSVGNF